MSLGIYLEQVDRFDTLLVDEVVKPQQLYLMREALPSVELCQGLRSHGGMRRAVRLRIIVQHSDALGVGTGRVDGPIPMCPSVLLQGREGQRMRFERDHAGSGAQPAHQPITDLLT